MLFGDVVGFIGPWAPLGLKVLETQGFFGGV